jgi:uncharacterized protein
MRATRSLLLLALTACGTARPLAPPCPAPPSPAPPSSGGEVVAQVKEAPPAAPAESGSPAVRMAKRCAAGDEQACARIEAALTDPRSEPSPVEAADKGDDKADDKTQASPGESLESQCDKGDIESCASLGLRLLNDPGPRSLRAPDYLRKACDADHAAACNNLGFAYDHRIGALSDSSKAFELFSRACDLGSAMGCSNAGRLARNTNTADAAELFDRACKLGAKDGCVALAGTVEQMRSNCEAKPAQCNNWGYVHSNGIGVAMDKKRALEIYEKACSAGAASACYNAGLLFTKGATGKVDNTRATARFQRACKMKHDEACFEAQRLTRASR